MDIKFVFEQQIYPLMGGAGEHTKVEFAVDEPVTTDMLLGYFVRFAVAAGYITESVEDAIVQLGYEIEGRKLKEKYEVPSV